jgi:hypothetical protein
MTIVNSNTMIEKIKKLSLYKQDHIYSFLGEVLVLGSQIKQIT